MTDYQLMILGTTDVHAHISLYDYFMDQPQEANGFILAGSKIKALKAQNDGRDIQTIVVDNGDVLQGNLVADYAVGNRPAVHPVINIMNEIGYDAGTLGNHEFNYGLDFLFDTMAQANFPVVNCNVKNSAGEYIFKTHTIISRTFADGRTVKVGVIGVVPEQILIWDKAILDGQLIVDDMYEAAGHWAGQIKGQCDIIICLCHSGFDPSQGEIPGLENQVHLISTIADIDAMIFGHTHQQFPGGDYSAVDYVDAERGTINGTFAVQPVSFGTHLGVIQLTLTYGENGFTIKDGKSEVIGLKGEPVEPQLAAVNERTHHDVLAFINSKVGCTSHEIESFFSQVAPSRAVELIAKSTRSAFSARVGTAGMNIISTSAPLKAGRDGGDDYVMVKPGDITLKDVMSIYRFPNKLTALNVPGRLLKEWLEWSASAFNTDGAPYLLKENQSIAPGFPSYNMDLFYELDYTISLAQPPRYNHAGIKISDSERVTAVTYQGAPLDDEEIYIVLTHDYRANFTPFLKDDAVSVVPLDDIEVRDAVSHYVKTQGVDFTPHIPFKLLEDGRYLIKTSRHAQTVAAHYPVTLKSQLADGYALFEIDTKELRT
ncbi:5'-nucleotidase C-terminal domain-containing protein [Macrococcus equipercicus]|uniref:5'-nucleotidase C-terminal domain-containing protein n=1 Tax=Macrococcus equipercicus TaxID=69967 RepID=A0A9Q9BMT9_9STAP|nr:5'-nucleotidase C-terminal domain-containing protein [Macrococcus equipercicus]KAA1037698.1 hypothetical protein ERX35_009060 [Macrococcus equipercicus]UTH13410.1 5'-nucleotidase C-terminal domain-containing protein [Macrococcus equipercicus]